MTSPEEVADTADLLTPSSGLAEGNSSRLHRCCRRLLKRGWFFVEPVLIAFCFNEFPMTIIKQKYSLDWITVNVFNSSSSGSWPSIPSPCDPNITDFERHQSDKVQSLTSLFGVIESVVFGVPALIVTVLLGAGSDQFGRRQLTTIFDYTCRLHVTVTSAGKHRLSGIFFRFLVFFRFLRVFKEKYRSF